VIKLFTLESFPEKLMATFPESRSHHLYQPPMPLEIQRWHDSLRWMPPARRALQPKPVRQFLSPMAIICDLRLPNGHGIDTGQLKPLVLLSLFQDLMHSLVSYNTDVGASPIILNSRQPGITNRNVSRFRDHVIAEIACLQFEHSSTPIPSD
jgi:hypothetical protein